MTTLASYVGLRSVAQPIITVSTLTVTSTAVSLGSNTSQTKNNFSNGSYTTGWLSTLTGLSNTVKVSMNQNGALQTAVCSGSSTINTTSNSGVSWTTLTGANGLPAGATAWPQGSASGKPNYTHFSQSATGQYQLATVSGGLVYTSANYGASWVPAGSYMGTPTYYLPFDGSIADITGNSMPILTGSVTYVAGPTNTSAANAGVSTVFAANMVNPVGGTPTNYIRGSLPSMTNFSMSCTVNLQSFPTANNASIIMCLGNSTQTPVNIAYVNGVTYNSTVYSGFMFQYYGTGNTNNVIANVPTVALNTWYNLSIVFSTTGTVYAYVNGALVGSTAGSALLSGITMYSIGAPCHAAVQALNGYVDEVRIYNTAPAMNAVPPTVYLPLNGATTDVMGNTVTASSGITYGTGQVGSQSMYLANSAGTAATKFLTIPITLGTTQSFTVSFWFNASAISGSSVLFEVGTTSSQGANLYIGNNGILNIYLYTNGAVGYNYASTLTIVPNTWYLVTYVYNYNSTSYVYINNTVAISFTPTAPINAAPTTLAIGAVGVSGNAASFNGYIDDFRFYNTVVQPTPMIPQNYQYSAMSGTGQYQLVAASTANAQGGLFFSTNYGLTWSAVTAAQGTTSYSGLAMSNSGQTMLALGGAVVTPQQSSLAAATWTQSGVTWTASASSLYNTYQAYFAFNNAATASWNTVNLYNAVTGAYGGSTSTTVLGGVGAITGEYLQIQSSVPLAMSSYSLACGGWWQLPKTYFIVGSSDNVNWYPIQSGTFNANPYTTNYTGSSNYILVNQASAQTFVGNTATTVTTVIYPAYTTQAYTYFRIICPTMCGNPAGTNAPNNDGMCIGEWYINFLSGQSYSMNYGISWTPALTYGGDAFNIVKNVTVSSLTNYYTLPSFTPVSTGITFSCRFVMNGTPAISSRIFEMSTTPSKGGDSDTILMLFTTGSQLLCQQIVGTGSGTRYNTQSSTSLTNGQLYHAVWTIDGSGNNVLYLNGVSNATSTRVINVQNYPYFYLGHSTWTADPASAITFVDFRMYNRALSAGEVTALYQTNTTTTSASACAVSGNGQYTLLMNRQTANLATTTLALGTESMTYLTLPGINANINCGSLSATGQYIVITTQGTTNNVFYSINYGVSFTALTVGSTAMTSCAIAYDGSYITVTNATTTYTLNLNSVGYNVAVGNQAGQTNQALNAIAIGNQAATTNQVANSIVLNATGSALNAYDPGFFVGPVASASTSSQSTVSILGYGADSQVVQIPGLSSNPSGYVGIGTTNPLVAMHVYTPGTLNSTNNSLMSEVRVCTDDNQIARIGCYEEPKGTVWGGWMQYNGANVINGADLLQFGGRRSGIDKTYMSIGMDNGFVGIGTIAPASLLHVAGSSSSYTNGLFQFVNTNASPLCMGSILAPSMSNGSVAQFIFGQSLSTNNAFVLGYFHQSAGSSSNYINLSAFGNGTGINILAGGNVGIGTANPTATLQVHGSGGMGNPLRLVNTTSGSEVAMAFYRNADMTIPTAGDIWVYGISTYSAGDRNLGLGCNGTQNVMTWKANGNVGIGTTDPVFRTSIVYNGTNDASTTYTGNFGLEIYNTVGSGANNRSNLILFTDWNSTQAAMGGYRHSYNNHYLGGLLFMVASQPSGYNPGHPGSTANASASLTEAMRITPERNVGIGTQTPGYTLHVVGTIYATGDITAFSDQRFKQNIQPLDGALAKILQLSGYSYTREDYRAGEKQIGLLAQEVKAVYPEAVLYDEAADKYSMNYSVMVAPLIQAIKELNAKVEMQSQQIAQLMAMKQ
jgi:hypothetical protein